jgi:hypothetical protein
MPAHSQTPRPYFTLFGNQIECIVDNFDKYFDQDVPVILIYVPQCPDPSITAETLAERSKNLSFPEADTEGAHGNPLNCGSGLPNLSDQIPQCYDDLISFTKAEFVCLKEMVEKYMRPLDASLTHFVPVSPCNELAWIERG